MAQVTLHVQGLDCAEEIALLRNQLEPIPGVQELSFDLLRSQTTIDFDDLQISASTLIAEVGKTGLRACQCSRDHHAGPTSPRAKGRLRLVLCAISGIGVLAGFIVEQLESNGLSAATSSVLKPSSLVYAIGSISGFWFVLPKAWSSVRNLRLDMNVLMTVATIGAFLIGEYSEGATVAFLFCLSLILESWSVDRARRAVESLMTLSPTTASQILANGTELQVPASSIGIGSTIRVRPGSRFPLDGEILRGDTTVDQAPITGESLPVSKSPGDQVFAGTINVDGLVDVRTSKSADDSVLARILRLISDGQRSRSNVEKSIERFARFYTPTVMVLALLVMAIPPILFRASWSYWFYHGLVLLVIACPCALVISTPVSVIAAMTSAANQGVLVKGGRCLEMSARLKAMAFDKTGTLTIGQPKVSQVIPLNGITETRLLELAMAVGSASDHPLSRAIAEYASARHIAPAHISNFRSLSGRGITANVDGQQIWIGSIAELIERGLEIASLKSQIDTLNHEASSLVAVSSDREVYGLITINDTPRPNAAASISALRTIGIDTIVLLTGDNPHVSSLVSQAVGIEDLRAELLPEDKLAAIKALVAQHHVVAMVGDGVNDAPALAAASLGIAMGHVGTDTALETADVVLMNDDLSRIPWLITHARSMRTIIHQNVIAALSVKFAFTLLTIIGYANLWSAIAADTGMSLVVVANALRLLTPAKTNMPSHPAITGQKLKSSRVPTD